MRLRTTVVAIVALLGTTACEQKTETAPAAVIPATVAATAKAVDKGSAEERGRFIAARIEGACAVKNAADLSKAVELTRKAYEGHGFNQLSYAAATARYAADTAAQKELDAGIEKCGAAAAAPPTAEAAAPAVPGGAAPAGAEAATTAEATDASGTPPTGDQAPAADEAKAPPKPVAGAGLWVGNFTSEDRAGTLSFTAEANGATAGRFKGNRGGPVRAKLKGWVKNGKVMLTARSDTVNLSVNGNLEKGAKIAVGKWSGVIDKKRSTGTWRATHK